MRTTLPSSFVVLGIAAIALAGCGSDEAAATAPDVDGREFVSTDVTGHQLVEGTTIRLSFDTDTVSANAGCNTMSAGYTFDGDTLEVEALAMTAMGCDDALTDQDAFVSGLLGSGPTVTTEGDELTLTSGEETIVMVDREVAEPDLPLEGTPWSLDGMIANEAISTVPVGVEATLSIEDGQATVNTGCNQGMTSVEVTDSTLTFEPMAVTLMLCEDDANRVQDLVLSTLSGEVTYEIESDHLSIRSADGSGLDYRAAS